VLLEEFNTLDEAAAAAVLIACAAVPSWAESVVQTRPFEDLRTLLAYADSAAAHWTSIEVARALADHPRIGEHHRGPGSSARLSRSEQGGVLLDSDVATRLAEGNRRYEERFGRIFLVRAAGRSAEEILASLEDRLTNDPDTELAITTGQLREIAALRLQGVFG
jgi:2-oxo-4-hydroxy-4-carboxy-5-ureidoimidazoline decarboxylase